MERLFFKADELDKDEPIEFGQRPEERESGEEVEAASEKSSHTPPEKIFAIRKKTEVRAVEEGKDEEGGKEGETGEAKAARRVSLEPSATAEALADLKDKAKGGEAESKTETRKYYRTYEVTFGEEINMDDEDTLAFECFIVVDDKGKKQGKDKKEKTEEEKEAAAEEKRQEIVADPASNLVMATLGGAAYNAGINATLPMKKKNKEREVLYAVDKDLEVLVLLVKGQKGE